MRRSTIALSIVVATAILATAGCERPAGPKAAPQPAAAPAATGPAVIALCPVCTFAAPKGMEVEVSDKTPTSQYQGKSYYFCSDNCKAIFDQDPARYVAKMEQRK